MLSSSLAYQADALYRPGLFMLGNLRAKEAPRQVRYEILRALSRPNGLYDDVSKFLRSEGDYHPDMKALAQPTPAVIQFYGAKLLGGDPLEIKTENQRIVPFLEKFHTWSNLDANRPMLGRQIAMLGDQFYKVVRKLKSDGTMKSVYFEIMDPAEVRDFDVDERGHVVWIRIEVKQSRRAPNGTMEKFIYIEVWSKAEGNFRSWEWSERQQAMVSLLPPDDVTKLGTPKDEILLADMGIDFVPVVHVPFEKNDDEKWGTAAVWNQLDKLTELDLVVTELHSKMFGYGIPDLLLESQGSDGTGNPRIPPDMAEIRNINGKDALVIGREKVWSLPGGWTLKYLIADLDWEHARGIVTDHYTRLERSMPELLYGRLGEVGGDLSGRAIRYMMLPALDRVNEVTSSMFRGLAQAGMMALTIGAYGELWSLDDLGGDFDEGALEHTFEDRDPLPMSEDERQQAELLQAQSFKAWRDAGLPVNVALQRAGYEGDELKAIMASMEAEAAQALELAQADREPADDQPPVDGEVAA